MLLTAKIVCHVSGPGPPWAEGDKAIQDNTLLMCLMEINIWREILR